MRTAEEAMPKKLESLIERARAVKMTAQQKEAQRRSFAYGNSKIENNRITRRSINNAANQMAVQGGQKD